MGSMLQTSVNEAKVQHGIMMGQISKLLVRLPLGQDRRRKERQIGSVDPETHRKASTNAVQSCSGPSKTTQTQRLTEEVCSHSTY